jgi:hypothetical protein
MAYKTSTGLRNYILSDGSLSSALSGGFINIYSGSAPATADAAVTGTLLCVISLNSTASGFTLDAASGGVIAKKSADILSGVVLESQVAGYYRHVAPGDSGTLSTSEPRIQGSISTVGAEMNLSSVSLASGATQTVDFYSITLPTF